MGFNIAELKAVTTLAEDFGTRLIRQTKPISKINISELKLAPPLTTDIAKFASKTNENINDIFESTSLRKLFTNEFKPTRQFDELGNRITTVINKSTGSPVEAIIEEESAGKYALRVKKADGKDDYLGFVQMHSNEEHMYGYNGTYIKNMNAEHGNTKYAGAGIRMHQLAIEDSIKNGTGGRVWFDAAWESQAFHYKSGFRPMENLQPIKNQGQLEQLAEIFELNKAKLNINDAIKIKNGEKMIDMNVICNESTVRTAILNGKKSKIAMDMELRGEQLQKWKDRIAKQPITMNHS